MNAIETHFDDLKPLIAYGTRAQEGLDSTIVEMIKLRASQINGCARCIQMHARDARKNGETEERIYLLDAWREATIYSNRERAVLDWTEQLTRLATSGVSATAFAALEQHFSEAEIFKITLLIGAINSFNRLNIGLGIPEDTSAQPEAA
ncbi:carboxymuconolactone decarboxylase family protein [Pseudoruegeria sp. HB172150]|uniref:carboxymuconolactone decarboxylase family protein n=1 Tax=Pseudoruegeria sp. HB172150 TaxID=2721164 RepID=UPI001C1329DA|nr:carboxymuconolactone decarboxylase family protein [Pseudoruegeria sp. HB172150]